MRRAIPFFCLVLGACGGGAATGGAAAPAAGPPASATPAMEGTTKSEPALVTVEQAQLSFDDAQKSFAASGSDCAQLCKALSSMTNATQRLCELSTETDVRCVDARSKLDAAKTKVKSTCGGCG